MIVQVNIVFGNVCNVFSILVVVFGEKCKDGIVVVCVLCVDGSMEMCYICIGINNNVCVEVLVGLKDGECVVIGEVLVDECVLLLDVV